MGKKRTKPCSRCDRDIPRTEEFFSSDRKSKDGFSYRCRPCSVAATRASQSRSPEAIAKHLAYAKAYRDTHSSAYVPRPRVERISKSITHKRCPRCTGSFPRTSEFFHKSSRARDGLRVECKKCHVGDVMRVTNPVAVAEYKRLNNVRLGLHAKEYRAKRWAQHLVHAAKGRTKRTGREAQTISESDILAMFETQGGLCHWFGIPMVPSTGHRDPQRPSLDRIDCGRGYHLDNIVLCCAAANMGRQSATAERFAEFCTLLRKPPQSA